MKHAHLILGIIYLSFMAPLQSSDGELEKFNTYINQSISEANIAGMAVAIVSGDSIIFTQGYGYSDIQTKEPFTPNTVINIASISKTFVGVALMNLVENGLISLDKDVNTFLPFKVQNPHLPESIITLRHLMSHSSVLRRSENRYTNTYAPITFDVNSSNALCYVTNFIESIWIRIL